MTVSLVEDAREAPEDPTSRTGQGQSNLVRRAPTCSAANVQAGSTDAGVTLADDHTMLSGAFEDGQVVPADELG